MFGAATAPSVGFGKAPATFGTATNTSTNSTTPFGGGFGGASAGGFGTPATAPAQAAPAFGAPTAGGFGAAPAAPTGFGMQPAPASTPGFGQAGAAAAPAGGFGTGTGGFYMLPAQPSGNATMPSAATRQQVQAESNTLSLQDFARQTALLGYLYKLDQSYDALDPKCHFSTFVYNSCGPGQVMDAIQKERYTAFLNGGGCSDEAYMQALKKNPDPTRLYPSPLHFSQELLKRTEKQKEAIQALQKKVDELLQDVDTVAMMDAANVQRQREVEQEEVMLRHRWYSLLRKMELLRRHGVSYGEESLLGSRVDQLRQHLQNPGQFAQLLGELRPYLSEEASRVAMLSTQQRSATGSSVGAGVGSSASAKSASGQPLLRSEVDPYIMKDWIQFAKQMQDGIETLDALLKTDLKEMQAVRERVESA